MRLFSFLSAAPLPNGLTQVYLKLCLVAIMWGGTFIAGRLLAGVVSPIAAATGRFGLAASLLLALLLWRERRLPKLNARQLLITMGLGASGIFLYNYLFFVALSAIPASRTALFVAFNPVAVAIAAAILHRDPLSMRRILGIILALVGALIVVNHGDLFNIASEFSKNFGVGEMAMCTAVLCWATYTILGRNILGGMSALAATTYASLWGFVFLLIAFFWSGAEVHIDAGDRGMALACLGYLSVLGTVVGFVWYYEGVRVLGSARTAVFTNLVPLFGVLFGALVLHEPITVAMLSGGALIIAGVVLTNSAGKRA